jgi:membrane protein
VNGPLLSQGLSWQAVFATFAALWVTFAIAGFWLREDTPLRSALLEGLANAVPGLIDTGGGGAVRIDDLLSVGVLGWTGAIAALGLIWTAIGWLSSGRAAVRVIAGLPADSGNFILLKLRDAGLTLAFGVAVLISAALSLGSTSLLQSLFDWIGVDRAGPIATVATRIAGIAIALVFDAIVLWLFFRVASGMPVRGRPLIEGVVLGAVALGVLKTLGGALLGGASSNPLLASFAVIIGLLIWFNLICQAILLAAAWVAEADAPRRTVVESAPRPDDRRAM